MTSRIDSKRFADGQAVAKADLRDAFDAAREELGHGGYAQPAGPELPPRRVEDRLGEMLSVKDFGAVGDGQTDDSGAFQAAIDTGRAIYVPMGDYVIVQGLKVRGGRNMSPATQCVLIGEAGGRWNEGGAEFARPRLFYQPATSGTDEPLLTREAGYIQADQTPTFVSDLDDNIDGTACVILKNLHFLAKHGKASSAVDLHLVHGGHFENCWFESQGRGLTLWSQCFDNVVLNCKATHWGGQTLYNLNDPAELDQYINNTWAFSFDGHVVAVGLWVSMFGTAIRGVKKGTSIYGCRIENSKRGILLGGDALKYTAPSPEMARGFHLSGLSLENVGIGIHAKWIKSTSISGFDVQGYGHSDIGLWIEDADLTNRIESGLLSGSFNKAAIINDGEVPLWNVRPSFVDYQVRVGGVNTPLLTPRNGAGPLFHFLGTEMFSSAVDPRYTTMTAFHDLMLPGLTGLNIRDFGGAGQPHEGAPAFAKNLGDTVTPTSGASSVDVSFWTRPDLGKIYFSSVTKQTNTASELEAGTYYYALTIIQRHAESRVGPDVDSNIVYKELNVATDEEVRLSLRQEQGDYQLRIYRGRDFKVFDGYWNVDKTADVFVDDGRRPFDGRGIPPMKHHLGVPDRTEDDANYQIIAQPSWHTTTIVTNKATTGFTIEFGTPPPDDQQTVTWLLFRP